MTEPIDITRAKAAKGARDARRTDLLPPPTSPIEVARKLLADRYSHSSGVYLLRRWRGCWWRWQTSHWSEVEETSVRAECYRLTENAAFENDKGLPVPWRPNRYKVGDLLDAIKAVAHLPEAVRSPSWTTGTPTAPASEIVACANGLLHVGSRTLYDHDPGFFNTVAVPFDFDPEAPAPTRWLGFLSDLWADDADAVDALGEFVGYVIGARTDLHKILLLVGPTRAGKGVIGRILKSLVGMGNAAGPTLASLGTNFGLSPLIGKPLAIVSDARLGGAAVHQVVERLLSVSGEDMLTIDRKYQEPWTGTLPTRFLVISNELPRFGDASGAIANRFIVLTLARSWLGRENHGLTHELEAELPGILNWALTGLDRLSANGRFTEPTSSRDAIVALADLVSPVAAFVRDRCEVGALLEVPVDRLYAAWRRWCEDNGRDRPGTVQVFGRDLRAVVPSLAVTRPRDGGDRERHYVGLTFSAAHNGEHCGPLRTTGTADHERYQEPDPVRSGPRSSPLWAVVEDATGPCSRCDHRTGLVDEAGARRCSRCRLVEEAS